MPVRRTCSFCGNEIEPGTGKMFIRKDGTVYVFCSSKCQNNMVKLRRVPRWTPWTQAFRRAAGTVSEAEAAVGVEEAPAAETPAVQLTIDAPKGKDVPADLIDLMDKRLGPDLGRGDLERYYAGFLENPAFRTSISNWARKAHAGKAVTHIEKNEFAAWKDTPEGRRVFKAWLDGQWQQVKGRHKEEEGEETAAPSAKKAKKGA